MQLQTDDRLRQEFDEQGYIILSGFLEPRVIEGVRAEMKRLVSDEARKLYAQGKIDGLFENETFERRLLKVYKGRIDEAPRRWRETLHLPGMFDLFFHPRLLDTVEMFLGEEIRL